MPHERADYFMRRESWEQKQNVEILFAILPSLPFEEQNRYLGRFVIIRRHLGGFKIVIKIRNANYL